MRLIYAVRQCIWTETCQSLKYSQLESRLERSLENMDMKEFNKVLDAVVDIDNSAERQYKPPDSGFLLR